ncbi:MAG: hypothetical protein GC162_04820 [Planctomycetes bacterium]|nr:hypothetical protein [Planctomycetota bacterium]
MFAPGLIALSIGAACLAGPMEQEHLYDVPEPTQVTDARLGPLMKLALDQPDDLTKLEAMSEVARYKFTGLAPRLVELLDDPSPLVSTSALDTLDVLDDRQATDRVMKIIEPRAAYQQFQIEQTMTADRMLARWGQAGAAEVWRMRAMEKNAPMSLRISAVKSLGAAAASDAATGEALKQLVGDRGAPLSLRLAAADAISTLHIEARDTADAAIALQGPVGPILAVRIVARATSAADIDLLKTLAGNPEPMVQGAAMARLFELGPKNLWENAGITIHSPDPKVRLLTVKALETRGVADSVALLSETLNDPHPDVRTEAKRVLGVLAQSSDLNGVVKAALIAILTQSADEVRRHPAPHWRAAEQAAILSGELDDKSAADVLMKLFDHDRPEVRVASIVGLRPLDVERTHQPVLDLLARRIDEMEHRTKQAEAAAKKKKDNEEVDNSWVDANRVTSDQANEAAQTLGVWRVSEADPVLRRLIPKASPASAECRAGAIWALGWLHENKPDKKLAEKLIERVFDLNPLNPEADEVRRASIITIGRMKAMEQADALGNRYRQDGLDIRCAARWALEHMTGKPVPEITLDPATASDAFISPLR